MNNSYAIEIYKRNQDPLFFIGTYPSIYPLSRCSRITEVNVFCFSVENVFRIVQEVFTQRI